MVFPPFDSGLREDREAADAASADLPGTGDRVYDCDGMALGRIVFDAGITAACLGGKALDKLYLFQGNTLQALTLSVPGSAFVR